MKAMDRFWILMLLSFSEKAIVGGCVRLSVYVGL